MQIDFFPGWFESFIGCEPFLYLSFDDEATSSSLLERRVQVEDGKSRYGKEREKKKMEILCGRKWNN